MAVQLLDIVKNWFRGTTVVEANWDNIREPLLNWAKYISNDINQLRIDIFGISYSLDNDGQPNLSGSLRDWNTGVSNLVWIFTNAVAFTDRLDLSASTLVLPDTFVVNQTTADYTVQFTDPEAARVITFDDPGGDDSICYLNADQTLTNKELTSPTLESPEIDTSIILNQTTADITIVWDDPEGARELTIPDPLGNDTFVFEDMAQVLANKTLDDTNIIDGATFKTNMILEQTNFNYTLSWVDPAAARALTIPDPLADDTFVFEDMAQTLVAKTLTSPVINDGALKSPVINTSIILEAGTDDYTLTWSAPSGARAYGIIDAGGSADFLMTAGAQTITGIKTFNAGALKLGGASTGVATLQYSSTAANSTFNLPAATAGTYDIITTYQLPSVSNLTYDNVDEGITGVWDFQNGAQLDTLRIEDGDIYLRDTDADGEVIRVNYYGYNGGGTRRRDFQVYDGHGANSGLMFEVFRATGNLNLLTCSYSIVSVNNAAAYGSEAIQTSSFYTGTNDYDNERPSALTNLNGTTLEADRLVHRASLCKGWIHFVTGAAGAIVSQKGYNMVVAKSGTYDSWEILFYKDFAVAEEYCVVGSARDQTGTGVDDMGSECIFTHSYLRTDGFNCTCYDTDASRHTDYQEVSIAVFGRLGS